MRAMARQQWRKRAKALGPGSLNHVSLKRCCIQFCLAFPVRFLDGRSMILVHPPVVKPSEPPPGIAKLAGCLKNHSVRFRVLDANLEAFLYLLEHPVPCEDTWSARSLRRLPRDLENLRSPAGFKNLDRYKQSVLNLNRILMNSGIGRGVRVSFNNYTDASLSPLRSRDLLRCAEESERNLFFPYFSARLEEMLEEGPSEAVGFSLNFLSQALCTFAMAGFLKTRHPSIRVILGGALVTSWMRRPDWSNPFGGLIDALVPGAGEQWLLSFFGKACSTCEEDPPDYGPMLGGRYFAPGLVLPFSTSRGCYWQRCRFCPEESEAGGYRQIPAVRALGVARSLAERTGASLVHFVDDALPPSFLKEIARSGFAHPWYGFVRATPLLAEPGMGRALKRSGCRMLKLGVESGSQDVLDRLQKGIDLETVSRILKELHCAGIRTYVYLLFGTPPEGPVKAKETLSFTVRHSEQIDFLNVAIFNMPICTRQAEEYGTSPFYDGDLSLYTGFAHPSGWDRPLVRTFLEKEFNRHPAVAPMMRRVPPLFTSNHAAFFAGNR